MSRDENGRSRWCSSPSPTSRKAGAYLRDLPEESRQLQSILQEAEDRGLCELVVRTNATLDLIDEVFRRHGCRMALFCHVKTAPVPLCRQMLIEGISASCENDV